ncbi:sigma-54 dependent transcriptional regulator [Fluviicola sp.]|jgi:two-component system response regulator HydG|uniref:sigma-54-dependent transcriptional regulator n=1 Tax=Fluviicola sp. TaxID=1917219 RepID=UPI002821E679|nr:sigma-54 dependent transcriptional regulator [Fluviicola sp.]MDR0801692.1 sigma-54 dependent transcriptional regulator [Fluviicola sp.]
MKGESVLVVDDSPEMLELLQRQLKGMHFIAFQASNVHDAIEVLKHTSVDLLITDLQMPEVNGMQLVHYVKEHYPELPVLVVTGYPSISGAVEAIKSGVIDYLVKPFTQSELSQSVEKCLTKNRKEKYRKEEPENLENPSPFAVLGMIGRSDVMKRLAEIIQLIRNNTATVLIAGESGTGKELVARAIHYSGRRSKAPFISVNCGAIPENLLESELFGFLKGSFTGAMENRTGFFQEANTGTIFLDEIGNASHNVQSRLLRVLQEKEITMIGSSKVQKIDVRIIAATNADLQQMVRQGTFREDLYYRLNVVNIEMPPLRERKDDIPLLIHFFIRKHGSEFEHTPIISSQALNVLIRHAWPGNVRELENVIQRALIMGRGNIDVKDLSDYLKTGVPKGSVHQTEFKTLKEQEKEYVLKVLDSVDQNKTRAARILGIDRKTLGQKIK